jgi:hypothetical protein
MKMFLVFLLFLAGCSDYSREEISGLIESNNTDNLVRAFYKIGEARDSFFISQILSASDDPRISHDLKFKGISVYQSKMIALKKISGLSPPEEITYKPDSAIINFYCKWSADMNLFNCDSGQ